LLGGGAFDRLRHHGKILGRGIPARECIAIESELHPDHSIPVWGCILRIKHKNIAYFIIILY